MYSWWQWREVAFEQSWGGLSAMWEKAKSGRPACAKNPRRVCAWYVPRMARSTYILKYILCKVLAEDFRDLV